MNSWIGRFLDYLKYERNYSVNTIAFYRQSLRNFVDYLEWEIGFGAASGEGQELDIRFRFGIYAIILQIICQ